MASEISWDFEELQAYIKKLMVSLTDPVTGEEVAKVEGPGAGAANTATHFRSRLAASARGFGRTLESQYAQLRDIHDTLNEVLASAVEADASLADEAKQISLLIGAAADAAPETKTVVPEAAKTDVSASPAGQIG